MEDELKKKDKEIEKNSDDVKENNENEKECKKHKHENHKDCKKDKMIEELTKKNEELLNKVLYSQAEFANYKKRRELELSNMLKYSNQDIVMELLPIVDNFERAIKLDDTNLTDELSKFLDGFKMIYTHLVETLKKYEVTEIDCLNKEFDPNLEQALMTVKVEGVNPGIVVEVLQKGYMLKDKMIRPALVKVSE